MKAFELALQKKIDKLVAGRLRDFTPSLQIFVLDQGRKRGELKLGDPALYFDLASLTKIIFGVSQVIELERQGRLGLRTKVKSVWPEFPYKDVEIRHLLTHTAGFTNWSPYYLKLRTVKGMKAKRNLLRALLLKEKRRKSRAPLYSDIDFLILSVVLEMVTGKSLEAQWKELAKKLGLSGLHFCAHNKPKHLRRLYAPTERCPWRRKILRGEVHDDNTWALGGVSTHAGLFGSLEDVVAYGKHLRKLYRSQSLRRYFRKQAGDWAMGFMMPAKKSSSAGQYFSPLSIGHTGFTGTSLWYDPRKDLLVIVLSNRVHPTRKNQKFRGLRPLIHEAITEI